MHDLFRLKMKVGIVSIDRKSLISMKMTVSKGDRRQIIRLKFQRPGGKFCPKAPGAK